MWDNSEALLEVLNYKIELQRKAHTFTNKYAMFWLAEYEVVFNITAYSAS